MRHDPYRVAVRALYASGCVLIASACGSPRSTLPSAPGVRVVVDTTFYETQGAGRPQWLASMRAGARSAGLRAPYFAYTSSQTRWSYAGTRAGARGCEPLLPAVELTIRYTMPRLVSDSTTDDEDLLEWRRYMTSLWRHEEGHAARAMREASEMQDSLARARPTSCAALGTTVSRAMDAVGRKHRALQAGYDARTRHGARQGAMLIMPGTARLAVDTTYQDTLP